MVLSRNVFVLLCLAAPIAASAQQKQSAGSPMAPPAMAGKQPAALSPAPATMTPGEHNPAALQLADRLPLSPSVKSLRNQLPPDPKAVERQLGLREPRGVRVNLEGRSPSKQEILNAFLKK